MTNTSCGRLAGILKRNADSVFIIDATRKETATVLTYDAAFKRAAAMADQLKAKGISRGDRIGIVLENGNAFAILYLACLLAGFTAVPVNSALPEKDRSLILKGAHLAALVTASQDTAEAISSVVEQVVLLGNDDGLASDRQSDGKTVERYLADLEDDALFSIHFTSGTTSLPKGVAHKVSVLIENAAAFNSALSLGPANRFVHLMPMGYMAGFLNTLLCVLLAEASVVLVPQFSAQSALNFWQPIIEHGGDTLWMTPTMLATLNRIDRNPNGVSYCKERKITLFCGTAPLPAVVAQDFEAKYSTPVIESYGLSELLLISANDGPKGRKPGSVGPLIPGIDIKIDGKTDRLSSGPIHIRTEYSLVGYIDYETGDPAPGKNDWFETGDIGSIDQDGYLFITGRTKDLIIRGGFNVSPRQIEDVLARQDGILDVAVVGAPHDFLGEQIVAAIVCSPDFSLAEQEITLRAICKRELGDTLIPDRFVVLPELPMGSTGKVLKAAIRTQVS